MKKLCFGIFTGLFFFTTYAQHVGLEWAHSIGSNWRDGGNDITTDAEGNIYVTGFYARTVDFDPGPNSFHFTSNGSVDLFILKLDAGGNFLWARSIGGISGEEGISCVVDELGNTYTAGMYDLTVDFDPSANTFNMTASGDLDFFILKLDANGNFVWAKSMGGQPLSSTIPAAITIDFEGNVYTVGSYNSTTDFDPGPAIHNLTNEGDDVFLQKLNADGNFLWAQSISGATDDRGRSVVTDKTGNVYTTGFYGLTTDFDPGPSTFNLTANGDFDIFVQKLDSEGNFIWARSMGGPNIDLGESIAIDTSGDVILSGFYQETVDFDPGPAVHNLTAKGDYDVFVQKLDTSGNFLWARSIGGKDDESSNGLTIDHLGNTYITGAYSGTVDFDPGPGTFELNSVGDNDIYILKLDQEGNFIWVQSMGGPYSGFGESIITDLSGSIYTTGNYGGTIDFDPGPDTFNLTSNGNIDAFIQKLGLVEVGIQTNPAFDQVSVFPNPNQGLINIDFGALEKVNVSVYTVQGQMIYQEKNIDDASYQLELDVPTGMYFLELSQPGSKEIFKLLMQ